MKESQGLNVNGLFRQNCINVIQFPAPKLLNFRLLTILRLSNRLPETEKTFYPF